MKAAQLKDLKNYLSKPRKIVIVTHWSPDGDAMGSSLGLYNFLKLLKHKVNVITPNEYPAFLNWLPGNKTVLVHNQKETQANKLVKAADFIFCLDFNTLKRIEKLGEVIAASKAKKMIIDHHLQPDTFADYLYHDVSACSTAQLVYEFISDLGLQKKVNKAIASCLYTGIMTDTGSFRYPSTKAKTHRIIADLIDAGAPNADIHNLIYDDNTYNRLKLLGFCLSQKLNIFYEYNTALFSLSKAELEAYNYQKGDTEGVVNYALSIKGIRFAAFFVERDGMIKTSFRSKGSFDVNKFARAHFNGGGHANAAGGMSTKSLDETLDLFVNLLPEYKTKLNSKK